MKIKYTHTATIASIILLSGCVTYPKNYTYSPTVTTDNCSNVTLPSPFANKPQPVHKAVYSHYRVPVYPDYPPYRSDSYYFY